MVEEHQLNKLVEVFEELQVAVHIVEVEYHQLNKLVVVEHRIVVGEHQMTAVAAVACMAVARPEQ